VVGYTNSPTPAKPYVCPQCKGRFRNSSDLKRHERSHGEVKLLQCSFPNCSFATNRRDSLRLHEKTHTGIEGRLVHPCVMCGKKFSSEQIASRHRKTCGQEKQGREVVVKETLCKICKKEFSSTYKLATHMKRHQGDLNFPCNECDAMFASTASLNKHKLSHQKSFQCELCQKMFSRKDNLTAHLQTHFRSEGKGRGRGLVVEYICSFCHCTVASREQLVAHFSQLHSQDHLADGVREEVSQVDEVAREEVVKDEQEDLQPEVAREEIVEYDGGVQECESSEGVEVILIDQEMRNQGILIIEEPVVYC